MRESQHGWMATFGVEEEYFLRSCLSVVESSMNKTIVSRNRPIPGGEEGQG